MKAIVLAGGTGSRLFPSTGAISKQLLPVYDKPMVYYPLAVVFQAQIKEVLLITTSEDQPAFQRLLGDGKQWGVHFQYAIQEQPNGIAEALIIGENFLDGDDVLLILGDNLFYGEGLRQHLEEAKKQLHDFRKGTVFAQKVDQPQRYGVAVYNEAGTPVAIEEKPQNPKSKYAITGLYCYPNTVTEYAKKMQPSKRGELEITEINNALLQEDKLNVVPFNPEFAWLDTGTHESLLEATQFVHAIEKRQGIKIGCLEEIALQNQWITQEQLLDWAAGFSNSSYGAYLISKYSEVV